LDRVKVLRIDETQKYFHFISSQMSIGAEIREAIDLAIGEKMRIATGSPSL
jgi:hypothetical protein